MTSVWAQGVAAMDRKEELETLQVQILRLQRQVRVAHLGWVLGVALALLGAAAQQAGSQQAGLQPAVIRTRAVEVVDDTGSVRVALDARYGVGALRMADARGRVRAGLFVFSDGAPVLQFADSLGRARLRLKVDPNGEPAFWLLDPLERHRIGLKVLAQGIARIWLFDTSTGQVFFQAP